MKEIASANTKWTILAMVTLILGGILYSHNYHYKHNFYGANYLIYSLECAFVQEDVWKMRKKKNKKTPQFANAWSRDLMISQFYIGIYTDLT